MQKKKDAGQIQVNSVPDSDPPHVPGGNFHGLFGTQPTVPHQKTNHGVAEKLHTIGSLAEVGQGDMQQIPSAQ